MYCTVQYTVMQYSKNCNDLCTAVQQVQYSIPLYTQLNCIIYCTVLQGHILTRAGHQIWLRFVYCAVLYCAVPYCTIPYCTTGHGTVLYFAFICSAVLLSTVDTYAQYNPLQHSSVHTTVQNCTVQNIPVLPQLYCLTIQCTWHCSTANNIALQ